MRTTLRFAAPLLASLLVAAVAAGPAFARTDNRSKPIVYVHGLDAFGSAGVNCNMWDNMRSALSSWGHTGTAATVMYYRYDSNCTYTGDHHGSHSTHHASGHDGSSHNQNAKIEHLGYHLAWMIYDHFDAQGAVDVVGHSMGGLITRYALSRVQAGDPDFPPSLQVEDVVTLGAPHTGSGWAWGCGWTQCVQIRPGSSFLNALPQDPQGTGGTDWTLVGSDDDGIVGWDSATGMDAAHKVVYLGSMNIGHSDYYNDTSDVRDADVDYWERPGPWYRWLDAPHVVRWSDFAMVYGTW